MRYNFKDDKIQDFDYHCPACLTYDIIETLDIINDDECIEVFCESEMATEIIRNLLAPNKDEEKFTLGMFEIDGVNADYDGAYIISITNDRTIWCQPAYNKDKLLYSEGKFSFVDGDMLDSEIIDSLYERNARGIVFTVNEDCEDEDFDDYEDDEEFDLYDIVEAMVNDILEQKFT